MVVSLKRTAGRRGCVHTSLLKKPQTIQALFYAISFFLVGISIIFDILIYKTAVITTIGEISSINYIMIISMFIHFYFLITAIIDTFRVNVKITGYKVTIENIAANIFYLTSVVSLLSKIIRLQNLSVSHRVQHQPAAV